VQHLKDKIKSKINKRILISSFDFEFFRLSDEIDELKNLPIRDADEEVFELHEKYERLQVEWKISRTEHDGLLKDIDHKQNLIQKYEFDMKKQVETVAYLNDEVRFQYFTLARR
jgi:hypothetical protein